MGATNHADHPIEHTTRSDTMIDRLRRTKKHISLCLLESYNPFHLATRTEIFALCIDAFVVVDIVLPAVLSLVLVRKTSIEACIMSITARPVARA